jgi:formylglycine-generating enzyme required for sulfatase activity
MSNQRHNNNFSMTACRLLVSLLWVFYISDAVAQMPPKLPVPPNMVWLKDSVFIDKTEIFNIHWLEYQYYLKQDSAHNQFLQSRLDSTVWHQYDSAKSIIYQSAVAYRYFPVVGLSQAQAKRYCQWRTAAVNAHRKDQSYQFYFRLPTEKEWELAAYGREPSVNNPFGYSHTNLYTKPRLEKDANTYYRYVKDTAQFSFIEFKKQFELFLKGNNETILNVVHVMPFGVVYGTGEPMPGVNKNIRAKNTVINPKMKPNKIGLTDMVGNVAEMVSEEGIAKGGSWAHTLEQSKISNRQYYTKPQAWLGFRCVCEVRRAR